MFKAIKNNWKKAEAAAVIQTLLEEQASHGVFDGGPRGLANKLVDKAWEAHPEVFDGRLGQRPHKLAIAAAALTMTIDRAPDDSRLKPHLLSCLGQLLRGVSANELLLPLSDLDRHLFATAFASFAANAEEEDSLPLDTEIVGA